MSHDLIGIRERWMASVRKAQAVPLFESTRVYVLAHTTAASDLIRSAGAPGLSECEASTVRQSAMLHLDAADLWLDLVDDWSQDKSARAGNASSAAWLKSVDAIRVFRPNPT